MTLLPQLERDLIDAAGRRSSPRRLVRRAVPLALAAFALAGLAIALVGAPAGDEGSSTRKAAGNRGSAAPVEPPARGPRPLPGPRSRPVSFRFQDDRYRMVAFPARGDLACIRLELALPDRTTRRTVAVTCAGERSLRRRLAATPVLNVGGGGDRLYKVAGFATEATTDVTVTGTRRPRRVVLSEPWRPRGWRGEPIRAFTALVAQPDRDLDAREAFEKIRVVPAP